MHAAPQGEPAPALHMHIHPSLSSLGLSVECSPCPSCLRFCSRCSLLERQVHAEPNMVKSSWARRRQLAGPALGGVQMSLTLLSCHCAISFRLSWLGIVSRTSSVIPMYRAKHASAALHKSHIIGRLRARHHLVYATPYRGLLHARIFSGGTRHSHLQTSASTFCRILPS